jgi:alkylation response protein AidB-like acyl-CoA dehydrogenase
MLAPTTSAELLEHRLGDPLDPATVFSFARSLEYDERDEFPAPLIALVQDFKLQEYFVPSACGGKLESFEEALCLMRVVSRRDLTVAIALGQTFLGAMHVWIKGSEEQKARVSQLIRQGKLMAFALTERTHGGDILAGEVHARATDGGYLLSGEKWLINNAKKAEALTVFARTDPKGGARGFSVFLVEKSRLRPHEFSVLPKVKTHGIRGADISGIRFNSAFLPVNSLIGELGSGFETALRTLSVTRILCAAFSLGAVDTALRATLDFALNRRIFGGTVFDIPHARRLLLESFVDLLICECVARAAARAIHVIPDQSSVWSAITKYFVPVTAERAVQTLGVVLGARFYLREDHWSGIFQKLLRDNAVVGLFDGSTEVSLGMLTLQLVRVLAARRPTLSHPIRSGAGVEKLFSMGESLPPFDPDKLELTAHGRNTLLDSLPLALDQLETGLVVDGTAADVIEELGRQTRLTVNELSNEAQTLSALLRRDGQVHKNAETFDVAKRYCALHAAVACLQYWLPNRRQLPVPFAGGEWVVLAMQRLLGLRSLDVTSRFANSVIEGLLGLHDSGALFSTNPFKLPSARHAFATHQAAEK